MSKKSKKFSQATRVVPDFDLWQQVSKTVEPLDLPLAKELEKFSDRSGFYTTKKPAVVSQKTLLNTTAPKPQDSRHLEFTGLNRRLQQKFLRGRVEIDARIDLHGESLETARLKLWRFLADCADQGFRTVLVITGKGSSQFTRHTLHSRDFHESSPRTGKLRNALPEWLHETEFRMLISGFQPAHPKHGGGGAVYIKLRNRNRRSQSP